MFTIRCTIKLLRRVDDTETPTASTTVLGDWYAKVLYSRPHQLVLCVSERSLLPMVLHAKESNTLAPRLTLAVGEILRQLGIDPALIEREQEQMRAFAYSRTQNRRVLGQLNDLMFLLSAYLDGSPETSLLSHSLHLAGTPCGVIKGFPDKLTVELFQAAATSTGAFH